MLSVKRWPAAIYGALLAFLAPRTAAARSEYKRLLDVDEKVRLSRQFLDELQSVRDVVRMVKSDMRIAQELADRQDEDNAAAIQKLASDLADMRGQHADVCRQRDKALAEIEVLRDQIALQAATHAKYLEKELAEARIAATRGRRPPINDDELLRGGPQ